MKCYTEPYEGSADYVFFSYCHADAGAVYPIIERLAAEGFRVWYDTGIHPGEDWPEVIARHLSGAKVFLAAVSKASAESHNCRNEVSFAISINKPFVSVVIEDFPMPLGMKLQLSGSNYIKQPDYEEEVFYRRLLSSKVLDGCRDRDARASESALRQWRAHVLEYRGETVGPVIELEPEPDEGPENGPDNGPDGELETRVTPESAVFIRVKTHEAFRLDKSPVRLGRSRECDAVLSGNPSISREHLVIERDPGGFRLKNTSGSSILCINDAAVPKGETVVLGACEEITVADEKCFFVSGPECDRILSEGAIRLLRCVSTGETRLLSADVLPLNRYHMWRRGILGDPRISREHHAELLRSGRQVMLRDTGSKHGTFLNGRRLTAGEAAELRSGDVLSIVETAFEYNEFEIGIR